jgi:hypothetical protein
MIKDIQTIISFWEDQNAHAKTINSYLQLFQG